MPGIGKKIRGALEAVLGSGSGTVPRPVIDEHFETNVDGLYVIGDLAGAPVLKFATQQGYDVIEHIAVQPDARSNDPDVHDVVICGAGASGLNAALQAKTRGLSYVVFEKRAIANTVEEFPEGKWVYSEPTSVPAKGTLWLEDTTKEDLLERWHAIIAEHELEIRCPESVEEIRKEGGLFHVRTDQKTYRARRVIVAIGQRGNPRRLNVPGEDLEKVHHRLYSPRKYHDEDVLVVGGGNSAIEAALTLSEQNRVTISYRRDQFFRIFRDNTRKLEEARAAGKIDVAFNSDVKEFREDEVVLSVEGDERSLKNDVAFVLAGSEPPVGFLQRARIHLENTWNWKRYLTLGLMFILIYSVYGFAKGLWPYRTASGAPLTLFGRPGAFWYTVLYTVVMTVFGLQALKRWGIDRNDRFQTGRYISLIGFQWLFFFLIPEALFQVLSRMPDAPSYASQPWRSYGIIYAWPLFFHTFFDNPDRVWVIWGIVLAFGLIPLFVLWHGKRYCSWVCGCGGLAETLGDRWRHLAPKGKTAIRWEAMNLPVLAAAVIITVAVLLKDTIGLLSGPSDTAKAWYSLIVDIWLVGIIPVTLYPFMGGKVWCRYWCPLAKLMHILGKWYGKFKILSDEKCIACGECTRYCQVGIPVMNFAMKQEVLSNKNSSCIGCGICVTVCPMDVLSFKEKDAEAH